MERTEEELKRLLEGRALVGRVLHEEAGADYVITEAEYFPRTQLVGLKFDNDDCMFRLRDVKALLDGQKISGYGYWWNKTCTLLPTGEGEEPAKQSKPAQPALTHDWQKRWWQFYYHFITADETSAEEAASMADEAITVARKHLEDEA